MPNRYISRKFLQELAEFSNKTNVHLYEGLKSMPVDLPYIRKNVKDFIQFISPLADYAPNLEPSEVISMIRSQLDYDRFITDEDIPTPDDGRVKQANCNCRRPGTRASHLFWNIRTVFGANEQ